MVLRIFHRLPALALAIAAAAVVAGVAAVPSHAMTLNYSQGASLGLVRPEIMTTCLQPDGIHPNRIEPESLTVGASPSYTLASQTIIESVRVDYSPDRGRTWYVWKWVNTPEISLSSGSARLFWSMGFGSIALPTGFSYRIGEMRLFWYSNHIYVVGASYSFGSSDYWIDNGAWSHASYVRPTLDSAGCESLSYQVYATW
jgi:hypothetical protein